jgi:hypothetical protein
VNARRIATNFIPQEIRICAAVIDVHPQGEAHLAEVALAFHGVRLSLGAGQGWQQQCRQNRDDGDHDQELDQREASNRSVETRTPGRFQPAGLHWNQTHKIMNILF